MKISVIIPALDEAENIAATVGSCRDVGHEEVAVEVIVVDGGSRDGTQSIASEVADRVLSSVRGRSVQMNAGAIVATGDTLLFLHADTRVPTGFSGAIDLALKNPAVVGGRFDIDLVPSSPLIWLTARLISLRSRMSKIATGDQAVFVRRKVFAEMGGYREMPLMEDLQFTIDLKKRGEIACLWERVTSSSRRWKKDGVIRTILLMWTMRVLYFCGVSPERLKAMYANTR